jgi:bifunctional non-homologous end joining protein LigD
VIVWDYGAYTLAEHPEKVENRFNEGLINGHLNFVLKGDKLKGEFSLVKLKGKQENAWLLIKKNDEFAEKDDILRQD